MTGLVAAQVGAPLLHTAARAAQPQSMDIGPLKELLRVVVDTDPRRRLATREATGATALHLAARYRHWRVAAAMLDETLWGAGALRELVTAQDPQGNSALHVCAEVDEHLTAEGVRSHAVCCVLCPPWLRARCRALSQLVQDGIPSSRGVCARAVSLDCGGRRCCTRSAGGGKEPTCNAPVLICRAVAMGFD